MEKSKAITMKKNRLKSVGAVLSGFILIVFLSIITDLLLKAVGVLPYDHLFVSTGLILVVIFYRSVYSLLGCYLAAKLAPGSPMKHALALGVIGIIISAIGAIVAADLGPTWYAWTLVVVALPIAWLGGKLFEVQIKNKRVLD